MALDLAMQSLRWRSLIRWHENSIEVAVLDLVADERGTLVAATGVTWRRGVVTEPPKIVPYYRLSLSTWPLSNKKELFCRFRRVKPGKSHTTGSLICAKPTRRRDQSTTLHYIT
jgi:hypothetical protein